MNGVVFHTSIATSAGICKLEFASHACELLKHRDHVGEEIVDHARLIIAQHGLPQSRRDDRRDRPGTSIAARIRPRPGNFELITMAMKKPRISSSVTESSVNSSVLPTEFMKSLVAPAEEQFRLADADRRDIAEAQVLIGRIEHVTRAREDEFAVGVGRTGAARRRACSRPCRSERPAVERSFRSRQNALSWLLAKRSSVRLEMNVASSGRAATSTSTMTVGSSRFQALRELT